MCAGDERWEEHAVETLWRPSRASAPLVYYRRTVYASSHVCGAPVFNCGSPGSPLAVYTAPRGCLGLNADRLATIIYLHRSTTADEGGCGVLDEGDEEEEEAIMVED